MTLAISCGEASGDLHGASLLPHLPYPIHAVTGPRMRQHPVHSIGSIESLQVMGFTDVAAALPRLIRQFYTLRNTILDLKPQAVLTIDYADYHLQLHRSLRKAGYRGKLIHYVAPSVWAWRRSRAQSMARHLDLLLCLLPFEPTHFPNLDARYVGHPLTAIIPPPPPTQPLIALFPGSRTAPIQRNFPLQLAAARALQLPIAVSVASPQHLPLLQSLAHSTPLTYVADSRTLMQQATLAFATSGTVTLELALHNVPTVVTYAIKPFDQFLARRLFRINLPYYALPNLIAQQPLFPELFGSNLTLPNLLQAATALLKTGVDTTPLRTLLGNQDASRTAATAIRSLLT